jgi:hypothetical protein
VQERWSSTPVYATVRAVYGVWAGQAMSPALEMQSGAAKGACGRGAQRWLGLHPFTAGADTAHPRTSVFQPTGGTVGVCGEASQ